MFPGRGIVLHWLSAHASLCEQQKLKLVGYFILCFKRGQEDWMELGAGGWTWDGLVRVVGTEYNQKN